MRFILILGLVTLLVACGEPIGSGSTLNQESFNEISNHPEYLKLDGQGLAPNYLEFPLPLPGE